jgi:hypothetical protein
MPNVAAVHIKCYMISISRWRFPVFFEVCPGFPVPCFLSAVNMKVTLLTGALAALAAASPVNNEKRQVNGLLSSLARVLGIDPSFDYIVLGGGTGGLGIAKRLAEDPSVTVAVIEAGTIYQVTDPVLESTQQEMSLSWVSDPELLVRKCNS